LEHKETNPNFSILTFLDQHYNDDNSHSSNKNKEHEKLPFKTSDCTTGHTSLLAFDNQKKYSFKIANSFSVKIKVIYNEKIYSSAILNKIWQPPQFA
jgi:hypothetical protein